MVYDNAVLNIGSIIMDIKNKIWTRYFAEKTRSNKTYARVIGNFRRIVV